MKPFEYIWAHEPIDHWGETRMLANEEETRRVLSQMPEEQREDTVYKTFMPADNEMVPVYLCKASNNGTTYIFADEDVHSDHTEAYFFPDNWYPVFP